VSAACQAMAIAFPRIRAWICINIAPSRSWATAAPCS